MADIVPELQENINTLLADKIANDEKLARLREKLADQVATYADAHAYASKMGELISEALGENVTAEVLPEGTMFFNIADRVLRPLMVDDFNSVADYATEVQRLQNKRDGIGLKGVRPELNEDRIDGIVNRVSYEQFEDVKWILKDPLVNYSMSVVDDTVKANGDFLYKAGMSPVIVRTAVAKCCKWCSNLEGKYQYGQEPRDVYRRHDNCKCETSLSRDGTRQNVWSKKKYADTHSAEIIERINALENPKEYRPAKTIKEAEEFIKKYIDEDQFGAIGVSYSGLTIEVANQINKTIDTFYNTFDVGKLGGIKAPAKNTKLGKLVNEAQMGYSPVRNSIVLNKDNIKTISAFEKSLKADRAMAEDFIANPGKYDLNKLSSRTAGVLQRSVVSGRATYPTDLKSALNHELGHKIHFEVVKDPLWEEAKANREQFQDYISGYAGYNESEYVAECFSAYMNGEDFIDPVMRKIFNNLRK